MPVKCQLSKYEKEEVEIENQEVVHESVLNHDKGSMDVEQAD